METRCSIIGCTNWTTNSQSLQFFSFPLDFDLCMLWVQKCARPELLEKFTYGGAQPFINKLVCSIHFSRSCFVNEDTTNGELKQHAIPTLNISADNVVFVKSEVKPDESLIYNTSVESEDAKNSYVEDSEGIISFIEVDSIKQEIPSEEEHGFDQQDEELTKTKSDDEEDLPLLLIAREELFFNETDLKYSDSAKSKQAYKKALQRALENSNQRSSRNRVNALRNAQKRAHESKQERETSDNSDEDPYHNSSDDDSYCVPSAKRQKTLGNFFKTVEPAPPLSPLSNSRCQTSTISNSCATASTVSNFEQNQTPKLNVGTMGILNGEFFTVVNVNNNIVQAQCVKCLPKHKIIKGSTEATTNFVKHLRRKHISDYELYEKNKLKKIKNKKSDNLASSLSITRTSTTKKSISKTNTIVQVGRKINDVDFNNKLILFLVDTMSPISILEKKSFINLFDTMGVNVMTRKTAIKRLDDMYTNHIDYLKSQIDNCKYVCTTADIWSTKTRSFMGVTCHLLAEDYKRHSFVLSCQRFSGKHDYKNIGERLKSVNSKFGINIEKIVGTVTDNASNLVKTFAEFAGDVVPVNEDDLDSNENDGIISEIEFISVSSEDEIYLPKHKRCACHTLNRIITSDCKRAIDNSTLLHMRHTHALQKCIQLWKTAGLPKSAEIIQANLGHTLSKPGITRWNSFFDSIKQLLSEKEKLSELCQNLQISYFTDVEIKYLEEYCEVVEPLAVTLDILQGEDDVFYGLLLPSLVSLKNKLVKKTKLNKFKYGGEKLLNAMLEGLQNRFSNILMLTDADAMIAAVSHPQFKLRWLGALLQDNNKLDEKKESIKRELVDACQEFYIREQKSSISDNIINDKFFDFDEEGDCCSGTSLLTTNKIELEVLQYLDDPRKDLKMLESYPLIKALFFKYNTCLPSSAPVERLFSFDTIINAPKRHLLTDTNFEKLVILKSNKVNA